MSTVRHCSVTSISTWTPAARRVRWSDASFRYEVSADNDALGVLLRYIAAELLQGDKKKRSFIEDILQRYGI
jgi:hypothetical protein